MIKLLLALSLQYGLCGEIYKKLSGNESTEENKAVCTLLIEDSLKQDLDVSVTLATAWEESRFTQQSKPTRYKCIGPLQIKYQYWCPNRKGKITITKSDGEIYNCDPYYHGVRALKYYINRFKPLEKALCYYNNSKKCSKKTKYISGYVKRVLKFRKKIKVLLNKKNIQPFNQHSSVIL